MSGKFNIDTTTSEQVTYIRLSGTLASSLDTKKIVEAAETPIVVISLRDIDTVEKGGIGPWRRAIDEIDQKAERLIFVCCSAAVVEQINQSNDFVGSAAVASVCMEMSCTGCERKATVVIDVDMPVTEETLTFFCADCESTMEPRVDADAYLAFCHQVPVSSLGEEIQVLVLSVERPRGPPTLEPGSPAGKEFEEAAEAIARAEKDEQTRHQAEMNAAEARSDAARSAKRGERRTTRQPSADATPETDLASAVGDVDDGQPGEVDEQEATAEVDEAAARKAEQEAKRAAKEESKRLAKDRAEQKAREKAEAKKRKAQEKADKKAARFAAKAAAEEEPMLDDVDEDDTAEDDLDRVSPSPEAIELAMPAVSHKRKEDQTDPALRVRSIQSLSSFEKTKPSIQIPSPLDVLRDTVQRLTGNLAVLGALLFSLFAAGFLTGLAVAGPSGIPAEGLLSFQEQIQAGDFLEAEKILALHADSLPDELAIFARQTIDEQRAAAATGALDDARAAFTQKDYVAAVEACEQGLSLSETEADLLYIAAESLRLMKRAQESSLYYSKFAGAHRDDARFDDALFWQAEGQLAAGKLEEAKAIYGRIVALPSSNFKNSATRRLTELGGSASAEEKPEEE